MMDGSLEEVLAYMAFPKERWPQISSDARGLLNDVSDGDASQWPNVSFHESWQTPLIRMTRSGARVQTFSYLPSNPERSRGEVDSG